MSWSQDLSHGRYFTIGLLVNEDPSFLTPGSAKFPDHGLVNTELSPQNLISLVRTHAISESAAKPRLLDIDRLNFSSDHSQNRDSYWNFWCVVVDLRM